MSTRIITQEEPLLVVATQGFEEMELTAPVDILRRLRVPLVIAGIGGVSVCGAHGVSIGADMPWESALQATWGGVLLPGGPASWALREMPDLLAFVRRLHRQRKLLAAICAAPMVPAAAGVLVGRTVTCYPDPCVTNAVTQGGAVIVEDPVVTDGALITGRGPGAAAAFGFAVAEFCVGKPQVLQLMAEMCYA